MVVTMLRMMRAVVCMESIDYSMIPILVYSVVLIIIPTPRIPSE